MIDKQDALLMYKAGYTLQAIGGKYGVSRQRINQVLKTIYTYPKWVNKNTTSKPSKSETYIANILKSKGYEVGFTPYGALYDLIVNKKIRIEIKHRQTSDIDNYKGRSRYFCYTSINKNNFDYLIAIAGNLQKNPTIYIIPSEKCPHYLKIPVSPKRNTKLQRTYREAWNIDR